MKTKITEETVLIGTLELKVHVCGDPANPVLLMLHSLSGNAAIFYGLIRHGLDKRFRLLVPELRGRGGSARPYGGYSLREQAADLAAILDHFGVERATVCGHSFGGLLGACFASEFPARTARLVLIDAATRLNPLTPQLILLPMIRLLQGFPDWDTYLALFKAMPFIDRWDDDMLPFVRRDMMQTETGLLPRASWYSVLQASVHVMAVSHQEWRACFSALRCPVLLFQATAPFLYGQHILEDAPVFESLALVRSGQHKRVPGNHMTMLFGAGAESIVSALQAFCLARSGPASLCSACFSRQRAQPVSARRHRAVLQDRVLGPGTYL